ncbi:hypothetical protein BH20ACI4_BH20ACI4_18260 [soil metagenome]
MEWLKPYESEPGAVANLFLVYYNWDKYKPLFEAK